MSARLWERQVKAFNSRVPEGLFGLDLGFGRVGFWGHRTREKGHRTRDFAILNPRNSRGFREPVLCFQYGRVGKGRFSGLVTKFFMRTCLSGRFEEFDCGGSAGVVAALAGGQTSGRGSGLGSAVSGVSGTVASRVVSRGVRCSFGQVSLPVLVCTMGGEFRGKIF